MVVRYKILFLVLFTINFSLKAQINNKWILDFGFGIEQHDKRLFDYSEKETLLTSQPENWGTYHLNVNIKRKVWSKQRINGLIGFGLEYEIATFLRPFDHSHFDKDSFRILRNLNRYRKVKLPLSLSVFYELGKQVFISGKLESNVLLYRSVDYTKTNVEVFPYTEGTFELDDVNFSLGINYRIDKIYFGISSRVFNFQKIDKIIFNYLVKDPRVDQKWEWYNPLRFDFTIGYMW